LLLQRIKIIRLIIKDRFADIMVRKNRTTKGGYMTTITVSLPVGCIVTLDKYMKQTGNNRSLALEYIIEDWKRFMRAQEARQ